MFEIFTIVNPSKRFCNAFLFLIVIFSFFTVTPSSTYAKEQGYTLTFSTETYADPHTVYLDFSIRVYVDFPSKITSGESGKVTLEVWKDWTTATLEYDPFLPQETQFLTPLGDSGRIYLGTFVGELIYYIEITNATVIVETNIEGNGSIAPKSFLCRSSLEEETFTVSHTKLDSSKENLILHMSFAYSGLLTVLSVTPYGIIYNRETREMNLGWVSVSENIEIVPKPKADPLVWSTALIAFLAIFSIVGYLVYRSGKSKSKSTDEIKVLEYAFMRKNCLKSRVEDLHA